MIKGMELALATVLVGGLLGLAIAANSNDSDRDNIPIRLEVLKKMAPEGYEVGEHGVWVPLGKYKCELYAIYGLPIIEGWYRSDKGARMEVDYALKSLIYDDDGIERHKFVLDHYGWDYEIVDDKIYGEMIMIPCIHYADIEMIWNMTSKAYNEEWRANAKSLDERRKERRSPSASSGNRAVNAKPIP